MTSHEQRRFRMRTVLGSKLGDEVAEDLMDSLPPFDWTRIATKDDLRLIEGRLDNIDRQFDNIDRRFDLLEQRMSVTMLKMSIGSTLVSIAALSGLMAIFA
jgi:hypothetical protein